LSGSWGDRFNYLPYHEFANEAFIDLKNELDWENLSDDPQEYKILTTHQIGNSTRRQGKGIRM
jgi:hypothetical protein